MLNDLTSAQQRLAKYMSEISERAYAAGWMDGLELALWNALRDGPFRYGQLDLTYEHLSRLKELSKVWGGWIYFDASFEETFAPFSEWRHLQHALGGSASE